MTDLYANPRDVWRIRELLDQAGLTEQTAARELAIDEETVQRYAAGKEPVPRVVILALERLVDMRKTVLK